MEMKDIIAKINYYAKLSKERKLTEEKTKDREFIIWRKWKLSYNSRPYWQSPEGCWMVYRRYNSNTGAFPDLWSKSWNKRMCYGIYGSLGEMGVISGNIKCS